MTRRPEAPGRNRHATGRVLGLIPYIGGRQLLLVSLCGCAADDRERIWCEMGKSDCCAVGHKQVGRRCVWRVGIRSAMDASTAEWAVVPCQVSVCVCSPFLCAVVVGSAVGVLSSVGSQSGSCAVVVVGVGRRHTPAVHARMVDRREGLCSTAASRPHFVGERAEGSCRPAARGGISTTHLLFVNQASARVTAQACCCSRPKSSTAKSCRLGSKPPNAGLANKSCQFALD
jgi:hypothetical protein